MSPRKATAPAPVACANPGVWRPVVVIPSAGHNPVAEGVATPKGGRIQRRTPNSKEPETEVRVTFPHAYCAEHRDGMIVSDFMRPAELASYCQRLQSHYGHGRLLAASAHLEWVEVEDEPCAG